VVNESGSNVLIPVRRETKTPSKPSHCFLRREALLSLLSTGWF